jgi:hypothetical protein
MSMSTKLIVIALLSVLFSTSCNAPKVEYIPLPETPSHLRGVMSMVTTDFSDDGCEVLLEIMEDGKPVLLMPINLADSLKVDRKKLIIEFHSSRIVQTDCQKGRPVVIETIKFVD